MPVLGEHAFAIQVDQCNAGHGKFNCGPLSDKSEPSAIRGIREPARGRNGPMIEICHEKFNCG
jgi:hypothetical protein